MYRLLTRILCFTISFQLFVGCNSSQLAVEGGNSIGDVFSISGSIVKTLQRVNGLLMSSAYAAPVETGRVQVTDYSNPASPKLIKEIILYDNERDFDFQIPKSTVANSEIISVEYVGANDVRQKLQDLAGATDSVHVILDADGTFETAIVKAEIKDLTDVSEIRDVIKNYDATKYEGFIKLVGSTDNFVRTFKDSNSFAEIGALMVAYENEKDPKAFLDYYETIEDAANAAPKAAAQFVCNLWDKPSVEVNAEFEAKLSFSTVDEKTKGYFGALVDFGTVKTKADIEKVIDAQYKKMNEIYAKDRVLLLGMIKLQDAKTGFISGCNVRVGEVIKINATSAYFDALDFSKYGKVEAALADVDIAYGKTEEKLKNDIIAAGLKPDDKSTGQAIWDAQIAIIKGWHADYTQDAKDYKY